MFDYFYDYLKNKKPQKPCKTKVFKTFTNSERGI